MRLFALCTLCHTGRMNVLDYFALRCSKCGQQCRWNHALPAEPDKQNS